LSTPFRLLLPVPIVNDMFAQVRAELPNECCGLLAGTAPTDTEARVVKRYPLANIAASPIRYHNDANDLFAAFRDIRLQGLDHLAIYHSHPTSDPIPSATDRKENFYGALMVHLIISMKDGTPLMRSWRLGEEGVTEVQWEAV
jgi:proteasome lid subunit RPN8/RPN11